MILKELFYKQYEDKSNAWILSDVDMEQINLLVGKNGAGKTKSINVINALSLILSENIKISYKYGSYKAKFISDDEKIFELELKYDDAVVIHERLVIDGVEYLLREASGKGKIKSVSGEFHQFKIPIDELKLNRTDEIQYPYLSLLNSWAKNVRLFSFNTPLGKSAYGISDKNIKAEGKFDLKSTETVIDVFNRGNKKYRNRFTDRIVTDFNKIGYNISKIEIGGQTSISLQITNNPNATIVGLRLKEKDLDCITDQMDMSMGMFRALTIIIYFAFYEFEDISGCVLIDDIGEGLDFERSTKLIDLLIHKAETRPKMQLIMTTNDRFVMNNVDLKYWQVIDREKNIVKYYNNKNSSVVFDQFKLTGLNNFDFFSTNFFKTGFSESSQIEN